MSKRKGVKKVPETLSDSLRRGPFIVHMGGAKAGSSALQNFLEASADRLESLGFAYEHRVQPNHDFVVSCGNGESLYRMLSSDTSTDNEVDSLVLSYFGKCDSAVCSSELFTDVGKVHQRLAASSVRLGLDLRVIFYVRDVMPYMLSYYDQVIKQHGEVAPFDEWVNAADWSHVRALRSLADVIPKDRLHVQHYERVKDGLIGSFLNVLGVDPSFDVDQRHERRRVNRSLTGEEREVLRMVNTVLGSAYAKELADELVYGDPGAEAESAAYDQASADSLLGRFSSDVAWVNDTFFQGEALVSVLSAGPPDKGSGDTSAVQRMLGVNAERRGLGWAMEKLGSIQSETEQRIVHALKGAATNDSGSSDPAVPADFEPLTYLLLNPDVLHAGFDPVHHFANHGKHERRTYKF